MKYPVVVFLFLFTGAVLLILLFRDLVMECIFLDFVLFYSIFYFTSKIFFRLLVHNILCIVILSTVVLFILDCSKFSFIL